MAKTTDFGMGFSGGAGYNFTRSHAFVGEFMWNHLFVNGNALAPIRSALQDPAIGGSGELYSLTVAEVVDVVRRTVDAAAGRMPVVAGAGFNTLLKIVRRLCCRWAGELYFVAELLQPLRRA